MQLTYFSDYSLRVLLYLAVKNSKASITEISEAFGVSRNHLVKVVHHLIKLGYLSSIRGKMGGVVLAQKPASINLGKIIQQLEPDFDMVECFSRGTNTCAITRACRLKDVFQEAKDAFLGTLSKYSLGDMLENRAPLARLMNIKT